MTTQPPDRTLELVSAAYGAAIDPERFGALIAAWDGWCDAHLHEAETAFGPISPKFEEAVSAAERLKAVTPQTSAIDATQAPMILLDKSRGVIATNAAASSLIATGDLDTDHVLVSRDAAARTFEEGKSAAYRCQGTAGGRRYLVVEASVATEITSQHPQADKVLILSLLDWDVRFGDDLRARFGLSDAEVRVARGLMEGQTAQEIAFDLGRSLATIRCHIKALLSKTSARRQTEFVQLLTILRQATDQGANAPKVQAVGVDFEQVEWSGPQGTLSVVRYGPGRPVLYFTTSSRPEETVAVRQAFADANLQITAPARPGFRGTAPRGTDASMALLDQWADHVAQAAGQAPLLVGHREGGILATKAAERLLSRGIDVKGLVLISTGAPVTDIAEFETAPATIKRSFLSAQYAQTALSLGYHTAARVFRSGQLGENKIIEYFYRDSPSDAELMSHPAWWQITRDNIAYCFSDPSQIARDLRDWGSDWSASLDTVIERSRVLFLHGEEHTFQLPKAITALAARHDNVAAQIYRQRAQMLLYQDPIDIARQIAKFAEQD